MQRLTRKNSYETDEPLRVAVNRNNFAESLHDVDLVVSDGEGRLIMKMGNADSLIFPRSAMKPLQAIALIELLQTLTNVPDLSPIEIAVICASHNGEQVHTEAVKTLLSKHNICTTELVCGAHWSHHEETMLYQVRSMGHPEKVHNNCSGKHAGMLIFAKLLTGETKGYADVTHIAQQKILDVLEFMTGVNHMSLMRGIDGCGAPVYGAPLHNWARAFSFFAGGADIPKAKNRACQRIRSSIAAHPIYVAGTDRACTAINAVFGMAITVKTGAEGVYSAAFHDLGLGAMVKTRDGNQRGAEVAIGEVINAMGYQFPASLNKYFRPIIYNWAGSAVGDITITNSKFQ